MSITRAFDVKLKVLPLIAMCEHKYYYEGPCRFGSGDTLMPGYDALANAQREKSTVEILKKIASDHPNYKIMDAARLQRTDDWDDHEDMWTALKDLVDECDVVVGSASIASDDLLVEYASRFTKPIVITPDSYASNTAIPAAIRATRRAGEEDKQTEVYSVWRWEQLPEILDTLRARKIIRSTRILLATRFASPTSYSSIDSFNSFEKITRKLGVRFRFENIHELFDQMTPAEEGGNHTTPGRVTLDLTEADMAEAEKLADELTGSADFVEIERDMLLKAIYAYLTVRKHMDDKDCCGFTAPCPDACSTRRLNEMKFTFCLTHSLNMEQGIPSCCEFDVDSVLSMQALMAVSGKCPYVGNTEPLNWFNDRPMVLGGTERSAGVLKARMGDDKKVYFMQHSVAHRRIKDPSVNSKYGLQHFAFDQGFGATIRYDFDQDEGQIITLCRFSPDGEKMFIANGEVVCGDGFEVPNCSQIVYFKVKDIDKFFDTQCDFGNHLVLVYGDYHKELTNLAKSLNVEPVVLDY